VEPLPKPATTQFYRLQACAPSRITGIVISGATRNSLGEKNAMKTVPISRRVFLQSSQAVAAGLVLSPARAEAATLKMKCSSSLPNDPKYANGRVYYDNLVKYLKANGLGEQVEVTFFPDNQLGQEIDVINSVKLGVIDLMVSGSSISANLVPLVGTFDLGYLFTSFPQQTKAFDAGAATAIVLGPPQHQEPAASRRGTDRVRRAGVAGQGSAGEPDGQSQC
jgi:hypothetical protein